MDLLIIKTGSTIPALMDPFGDFEDWFMAGLGTALTFRTVEVFRNQPLPDPATVAGVLVTGSPAMVSHRNDWSENTAGWLRQAAERTLPMLGVCYGHQLIAHALGGVVGTNPNGRQIGTTMVDLLDPEDRLLGGLGASRRFQVTHVESVLSLPPGARLLATTQMDPHHAFRIGDRIWGVQFHPEFDDLIMRGYLRVRRGELEAEGIDVDQLESRVSPAPGGPEVLARFARMVADFKARTDGLGGTAAPEPGAPVL